LRAPPARRAIADEALERVARRAIANHLARDAEALQADLAAGRELRLGDIEEPIDPFSVSSKNALPIEARWISCFEGPVKQHQWSSTRSRSRYDVDGDLGHRTLAQQVVH
jgi:hypothetical protein